MEPGFHYWSSLFGLLKPESVLEDVAFLLYKMGFPKGMETAKGDLDSKFAANINLLYLFGLRVKRLLGDAMPKVLKVVPLNSLFDKTKRVKVDNRTLYVLDYTGGIGNDQIVNGMKLYKNAFALAITFRELYENMFVELSKTAQLSVSFTGGRIFYRDLSPQLYNLSEFKNLRSLKFSEQTLEKDIFQTINKLSESLLELHFHDCSIDSEDILELFGGRQEFAIKSFAVTKNIEDNLFDKVDTELLATALPNIIKLSFDSSELGKKSIETVFQYINFLKTKKPGQLVHLNLSICGEHKSVFKFFTSSQRDIWIPEFLELKNMNKNVAIDLLKFCINFKSRLSPMEKTPATVNLSRQWKKEDLANFYANPRFNEDFENAEKEILGLPNQKETEAVTSLKKLYPDFVPKYHALKKENECFTKVFNHKLVIIDTETFALSKKMFLNMKDYEKKDESLALHHLMSNDIFTWLSGPTPLASQCLIGISKVEQVALEKFDIVNNSKLKKEIIKNKISFETLAKAKSDSLYSTVEELLSQQINNVEVVKEETLTDEGEDAKHAQVLIMKNSLEPTLNSIYATGANLVIAVIDLNDPEAQKKLQRTLQSLINKNGLNDTMTPVLIVCLNSTSIEDIELRNFQKMIFRDSLMQNNLKTIDRIQESFFILDKKNHIQVLRDLIKSSLEDLAPKDTHAISGQDIGILLRLANEYPFGMTVKEVLHHPLSNVEEQQTNVLSKLKNFFVANGKDKVGNISILFEKLKYWSAINLISFTKFISNEELNGMFIFDLSRFSTLVDKVRKEDWKLPSSLLLKYDNKQLEALLVQNDLISYDLSKVVETNIQRITVGDNSFSQNVQGVRIFREDTTQRVIECSVEPFEADDVFRKWFIHIVNAVKSPKTNGGARYQITNFSIAENNAALQVIAPLSNNPGALFFSLNDEKNAVSVEVSRVEHTAMAKLYYESWQFLTRHFLQPRHLYLSLHNGTSFMPVTRGQALKAIEFYEMRDMQSVQGEEEPVSNIYDCFISYNWTHQEEVIALQEFLTKAGVRCWIDRNDMGSQIDISMIKGVIRSKKFILCLSKLYLERLGQTDSNIKGEYQLAKRYLTTDSIIVVNVDTELDIDVLIHPSNDISTDFGLGVAIYNNFLSGHMVYSLSDAEKIIKAIGDEVFVSKVDI